MMAVGFVRSTAPIVNPNNSLYLRFRAALNCDNCQAGQRSAICLLVWTCLCVFIVRYQVQDVEVWSGGGGGGKLTNKIRHGNSTATYSSLRSRSKSSTDIGCWRKCPSPRVNHILWKGNGEAGLNDRISLLKRFGQIAGFLCANIWVEPPIMLLHNEHNGGQRVSSDLTWEDLTNITWAIEGDEDDKDSMYYGKNIFKIYPFYFDNNVNASLIPRWMASQNIIEEQTRTQIQKISSTWETGFDDFLMLDELVEEQIILGQEEKDETSITRRINTEVFVWEISGQIWRYPFISGYGLTPEERKNLRQNNPAFPRWVPKDDSGCQYISITTPAHVETIADSVWQEVCDDRSNVIFLHVRRGDAVDQCDTSIKKMVSYLNCTFANTTFFGNMTVLLATDERDPQYIDELLQMTNNMYPHVRMVHLDPIVERHIDSFISMGGGKEALRNNFLTFSVSNTIRWHRASVRLEQRKDTSCPSCSALQEKAGIHWIGNNDKDF